MAMSDESSGSTDTRIRWERRAVKEVVSLPKADRDLMISVI